MPEDADAYRGALDVLATVGSDDLPAVLEDVAAGRYRSDGPLGAEQLRVWFEDASVDLVKQWLAHPATMSEIDYDGFANGGDGVRKQGFQLLGAGQREAWEPEGAGR
jgi:hypothetical protein